jgi:hypothetical protein
MTEMTMYFTCILGAFFFFIKWQEGKGTYDLLRAALLFLFSTMFRPEAWMFAFLFSAYLLIFLIQNRRTPFSRFPIIVSMILPSLFILFWFAHNFREFGDPFYFLTTAKSIVQDNLNLHSVPFWIRGLQLPFLMFVVSPFLLVCILIGLVVCYRSLTKIQRDFLWFVLAQFALMVLATLYGLGTTAAPQRYVLISMILLTPFAAHWLSYLWQRKYAKVLVILFLFAYIGIGFVKSLSYPTQYQDIAKVGKYLKENSESGIVSPAEQICSELVFRLISGQLLTRQLDFLIQSSDHAALAAFSGRPRNFLFNILQIREKEMLEDRPSANEDGGSENIPLNRSIIASKLKEMQIAKIVLRDRGLMDGIPDNFHLEKTIGKYAIFSSNLDVLPLPSNKPVVNKRMHFLNENLGKGITLSGYRYKGNILPDSLSLLWKLDEKYDAISDYKVKIVFTSLKNPEKKFRIIVSPIFQWYKMDRLSDSASIEDNVPLFLPLDMPNSEYSLKVSLVEQTADTSPFKKERLSEKELTLAPLLLISSKREALGDVFKGEGLNWKALGKILITL